MIIRVVVIEDHVMMRELLVIEINEILGLECVGAFASYDAAAVKLAKLAPHVVLLDLGLPGTPGVVAARQIKEQWPQMKILVFSGDETEKTVLSLFAAGADGYILKRETGQQLGQHIRTVYHDSKPMALSPQIISVLVHVAQQRMNLLLPQGVLRALSPLENKLLEGFARGANYKDTCGEFDISVSTLKTHVTRIFEKCLAHSTSQANFHREQVAH